MNMTKTMGKRLACVGMTMMLTGLALMVPWIAQAAEINGGDWLVQINGALGVSYNQEDCGSACRDAWHREEPEPAPQDESDAYLAGDISRISVSGARRMDSGVKALFMTEWRVDTPETDDQEMFHNYQQYMGLDGPFGLIRAGVVETPYMQTGNMIDPFSDDALSTRFFVDIQSALHHTNGKGRGRATHTVRYDSVVSTNGFGVQAFYSVDNSEDSHNGYGAGLTYTSQGMKLFAQYYDNGEPGDDEAYKLGGTLGSERFMLFGQYEFDKGLISLVENLSPPGAGGAATTDGDVTAEKNRTTGADVWVLGAAYSAGRVQLVYEYGERKDSSNGAVSRDGHTGWILGAKLRLDKHFYFYTGYLKKSYNQSGRDDDTRLTVGATLTF